MTVVCSPCPGEKNPEHKEVVFMRAPLKIKIIIAVLTLSLGGMMASSVKAAQGQANKRQIMDMAGRKVMIPSQVRKIACIQGGSYEMVFALGGKDRISLVRKDHKTAYPLALLTNPGLKDCPIIADVGPRAPVNIEQFVKLGPEVVIYWSIPDELKKFDEAGIAAVILNSSGTAPTSLDECSEDQKKKVRFLADILGGDALRRYQMWAHYFDEKVSFIRERTATLPQAKRPKVYVGNSWGNNVLATWGGFSMTAFSVELCGGTFVGIRGPSEIPEVTREQLLAWAPDVIIVDNHGRYPEKVIANLESEPDWASLPAVKNRRLYRIPSGVFFLDKGTSYPVFLLWTAQKLHPQLFGDVDMIKEIKGYFKTFYEYSLTDDEAGRVLRGWVEKEGH